jgi:hypothetical protein
MNTIEFADTGVQVSELCLGTMMFGDRCDEAESDRILNAAMDQGVRPLQTIDSPNIDASAAALGPSNRGFIFLERPKTRKPYAE